MPIQRKLSTLLGAACFVQCALLAPVPAAAQNRPEISFWACNYWDSKNKIGYYSGTAQISSRYSYNETKDRLRGAWADHLKIVVGVNPGEAAYCSDDKRPGVMEDSMDSSKQFYRSNWSAKRIVETGWTPRL